jgi:hypothetical protein
LFATGVIDTGGKYDAGIVDTGGKFSTGVGDTSGNLSPVLLTPVEKLSLIPSGAPRLKSNDNVPKNDILS